MSATLQGRKAMVITVSDRCFAGTRQDASGPAVARVLVEAGADVGAITVVPDEQTEIEAAILSAVEAGSVLIMTTGGTGLAARDVTPEATLRVCERLVPGLAELMRVEGAQQTPFAALGRGVCGTVRRGAGEALVINLPGSPAGAEGSLRTVLGLLPHALDLLAGETAHEA